MNSTNAIYTGFEFEILGYPAVAIINKDLADVHLRTQFDHSVFIDVLPDKYNEFGHPTEEEYDFLNEMEKKVIEYLESQTSSIHVGHVTTFRKREIIFYTSTPETVEGFLDSFMPTVEREWNAEIEEDKDWQNVGAFYEQFNYEQD
jgi:hypothetical protein